MVFIRDIFVAPPMLLAPWRDTLEKEINRAKRHPAELAAEQEAFNRAIRRYGVPVAPLHRVITGKEQA